VRWSCLKAPIREFQLLLAFLIFTLPLTAGELPRKVPTERYAGLWNNSPFTSRPVIVAPEAPPEVNPLEDYALIGVSPVADGFRVTLINRNDPGERIVVDSSRPKANEDIKILGIDRQPGLPLATTVRLSMGRSTGTVGFERSLLTLTPPPAAAPPQQNLPINPANPDALEEQAQGARRQPRPRVVPPPANGQQQGARGQRPQVSPGRGGDRTDRRSRR
jgi:hypothetical protein